MPTETTSTGREQAARRLYELTTVERPDRPPWDDLGEPVRESFRAAADEIAALHGGAR